MPVIYNGADIDLDRVEKIDFIVENLLTPGLSMLAADPKLGKSWFALLMCLRISQGQSFLGYKTTKSACMYLALEDSDNRVKTRIKKLYDGSTLPDTFGYCLEVNDLSNGLIEQLEMVYNSVNNLRVIVIDTLQCIRGSFNNKDGGAYGYDYKEMNMLKNFAKKHNLAILLIHHTSKADVPGDPFFSISGTRGITGALDLMMVMKKEDVNDKQAKLFIRGRDVDSDAFVVEMQNCKWVKVGTVAEMETERELERYHNHPVVRTLNLLLKDTKQWRGRMSNLIEEADALNIDIIETPQKLVTTVKKLEEQLYLIDHIRHYTIKNGKASDIHIFEK